jgi:hypothetical protein
MDIGAEFYYSLAEWICSQTYSGLVHYFFSDYQFIYYVAQKKLRFFMHRLLADLACLQQVRLGANS